MRNKIIIGSMLVLTLLLLMPSIPAIQQNTIEDGIKQDVQEKLETINIDNIEVLEGIIHPLLYKFILFIINFRLERAFALRDISSYITSGVPVHGFPRLIITRPLIYLRGFWLFITALMLNDIILQITNTLGWDWDIDPNQ